MFCIRPETLLLQLAENALGAKPDLTVNLPLYQQLKECDDLEMANLIQLRTVCFSQSTWFSSSSGLKPYLNFCVRSKKDPYPVDRTLLELCMLSLVEDGKTVQVIENMTKSLVFAANFLGCTFSSSEKRVKNALKFVRKICAQSNKEKEGLESKDITTLWENIEKAGGLTSLSLAELRTFVMAVFCHQTLCRFSCASEIQLSHLYYDRDFFRVNIQFSKTDPVFYTYTGDFPCSILIPEIYPCSILIPEI